MWEGWLLKLNKKVGNSHCQTGARKRNSGQVFKRSKRYFALYGDKLFCLSEPPASEYDESVLRTTSRWLVPIYGFKCVQDIAGSSCSFTLLPATDEQTPLSFEADNPATKESFKVSFAAAVQRLHAGPCQKHAPVWAAGFMYKQAAYIKTARLRYFRLRKGELEYFRTWSLSSKIEGKKGRTLF